MVVEENEDLNVGQPLQKVDSILDRRKLLKRQRRNRFLQKLWRTGAISGIAIFLGWGLHQPEWKIRSLDQVTILGNTQISTQTLETLLPLTYPSSLIRIQPQSITQKLKNFAHIDKVSVSRQLFPPQVTVVIQERPPIAKVQCLKCQLVHNNETTFPANSVWLVDQEGIALPLDSYPEMKRKQSLPLLEIDGYFTRQKKAQAQTEKRVTIDPDRQAQAQIILPLLLQSPVSIQRLDLRDKGNLKIKSTLGWVHLSEFKNSGQLIAQLKSLDQLRSLPNKVDMTNIEAIDLSHPMKPTLKLKKGLIQPQAIDKNLRS